MSSEQRLIAPEKLAYPAEEAYRLEISKRMQDEGLSEFTWDDSEIDESKFDVEWNYVEVLCNTIPKIRNKYAH